MARIAIVFCLLLAVVVAKPNNNMSSAIAGRIVGGTETDISDLPYQVSLQFQDVHDCGGSIIGDKYILTAAHCVIEGNPRDFSIRAGSSEHAKGGDKRRVRSIIIHPSYNDRTLDNDIAVLELDRTLRFGSKIQKIELAEAEPKEGDEVLVSGWGVLEEKSKIYARKLQKVILTVVKKKTCHDIHKRKNDVTDNMFCAGVMSGGRDACKGDSGGPAVVEGKQAGIISWGVGCGRRNSPGVFTNVAKYVQWIQAQTR